MIQETAGNADVAEGEGGDGSLQLTDADRGALKGRRLPDFLGCCARTSEIKTK